MAAQPILCPNCRTTLQLLAPPAAAVRINCPRCQNQFLYSPHGPIARPTSPATLPGNGAAVKKPGPPPLPAPPPPAPVAQRPPRRPARSEAFDEDDTPRRPRRKEPAWRVRVPWAVVAVGVLLLGGLGGLAAYLANRPGEPEPVAQADAPAPPPADGNNPPAGPPQEAAREQPPTVEVRADEEPPPAPTPDNPPLLVLDPNGHAASVRKVLFTPDGREVVSVSKDKTVRITDVATGEAVRVFRLPAGPADEGSLYALAISPDGGKLAVGGMTFGNGKHGFLIYLIDVAYGKVEKVLRGHSYSVAHLDFTPDGRFLASGGNDGTVRLFDLRDGSSRLFGGHRDIVRMVAVSPDGEYLATASLDSSARVWHVKTGLLVMDQRRPTAGRFASVAWGRDGRTLATGCLDGTVQLWDVPPFGPGAKITLRKSFPVAGGQRIQVASLALSPEQDFLLYAGVDSTGRAGVVDLATGRRRFAFIKHTNTILHGSLSRDGTLAVTAGGDRDEIYVWKTADGSVVQQIQGVGQSVWAVAWAPDGRGFAWGHINSHRGDGLRPLQRTFRLDALAMGPAPTPDYRRRPTTLEGYSVKLLDFPSMAVKKDGQPLHTFRTPIKGDRIYSQCLLPGGKAVVGTAFKLYLVDLEANRVVRDYLGHTGEVTEIAPSPDNKYFLTSSSDRTVRLWDPAQREPLLSFFLAGQEWIAWTPQGYYAASAGGERLMGWLVNHGPEKFASFYPAVQFRRSLYAPEVIKLVPKTGSVAQALQAAGKKGQAEPLSVAQVLPPEVTITSPTTAQARAQQPRFVVKATARSVGRHPVTAVRLLVDGRPYQGQKGVRAVRNPRPGAVDVSWAVELAPGPHTLVVQAESAVSKALSRPRPVEVAGQEGDRPNLYVVAVGISAYPGRMALKYAAADAIAIARVFQEKSGRVFHKIETKLVTDRQATKANILKELAWLGSQMTERDVGVLFFAGHGGKDDDGTFYLIPVDARPRDVAGSCISGDALKAALEAMPGKLVAMLDACHSGAVADGFQSAKGGADDLVRDLVTEDYGVVVMCSSAGAEFSIESSQTKHGFFTLSLVEALSGKADFNRDGVIHIHEADLYAALRVQQLSGGMQNPVTGRPPAIRTFPLARP